MKKTMLYRKRTIGGGGGYDLHNGITPVMEMMMINHHHCNNQYYLTRKSTAVSEKQTVVKLTVEFLVFREPRGLLVV